MITGEWKEPASSYSEGKPPRLKTDAVIQATRRLPQEKRPQRCVGAEEMARSEGAADGALRLK